MKPHISICIPAFKNYTYLRRLLDSIKIQHYKHFEVVVTDDNPGIEIQNLCKEYDAYFELNYFKNTVNLNTPENWNESVRRAKYEWIKIMHDDDWFTGPDALGKFANAINSNPNIQFFFSAYQNIYDGSGVIEVMKINKFRQYYLVRNIEILIALNVIGPPSVTLYKKNQLEYDSSMKYVVDIDFYTRYCTSTTFYFIPSVLVNVGIHADQVTKYTHGVEEVHLKESLLMLNKKSFLIFRNILVFDGWWRLVRNFNVTNTQKLIDLDMKPDFITVFSEMIKVQKRIPKTLLRNGIISKLLMNITYLFYLIGRKH